MVVLQKRSKLITFRVSAEEHDGLVHSCLKSHARTVAEFARMATLEKAHLLDAQSGTIQGDLTTLGRTLGELDASLDAARKRIRELLGSGAEEPAAGKQPESP